MVTTTPGRRTMVTTTPGRRTMVTTTPGRRMAGRLSIPIDSGLRIMVATSLDRTAHHITAVRIISGRHAPAPTTLATAGVRGGRGVGAGIPVVQATLVSHINVQRPRFTITFTITLTKVAMGIAIMAISPNTGTTNTMVTARIARSMVETTTPAITGMLGIKRITDTTVGGMNMASERTAIAQMADRQLLLRHHRADQVLLHHRHHPAHPAIRHLHHLHQVGQRRAVLTALALELVAVEADVAPI